GCAPGPDGPEASRHARTAKPGRTSVRHDQSLDGPHPLPDEAPAQREDRDQPPHPCLQHETGDGGAGSEDPDERDQGLKRWRSAPQGLIRIEPAPRVLTRPRLIAEVQKVRSVEAT